MGFEDVDCVQLAQEMVQWRGFMNTVENFQVNEKTRNF